MSQRHEQFIGWLNNHSHAVVVNHYYVVQVFPCMSEREAYELSGRMINAETGVMSMTHYLTVFDPLDHYIVWNEEHAA